MKKFTVEYWVATYHGFVDVWADEDDESETIIARAKKIVYRNGGFGMCYEKFKIV